MARVNLDNDYPQIGRPVGSSKEVEALDVPLRNVSTCDAHRDGESGTMGCPSWKMCDRAFKGERPQLEVMKIITKEGGIRVYHAPCFDNVKREVELDAQGGYAEVVGGEGDTYLSRGSEKINKDCPDCARGECNRTHTWRDRDDIEVVCPTFPPAEEHPELMKFARIKTARTRGFIQKKAKRSEQLLSDHDSPNAKVVRRARGVDLELGKS